MSYLIDHPALLGGMAAAALAMVAWLGDWRRTRRRNVDAVGVMPWTVLFLLSLLAACVLLGLAGREWLAELMRA